MSSAYANDPVVRFLQRAGEWFRGPRRGSRIAMVVGVVLALWALPTSVFQVEVDEIAVIQRFGAYQRQMGPGLQFKLPNGIEKRTNVRVQHIYKEEFGMRTEAPARRTTYASEGEFIDESLMLTGDLNCALVPFIVQYRISDPVNFLFKVRDASGTLRDMSEAVMRLVVGDRSINEVLSRRLEIADQVKVKLQPALDEALTGITIVNVELKNTTVPVKVQPSFNEVNQAEQERERLINEARADFNRMIPAARGEARRIVSEAEGYALNRINTARGDSARFMALYEEYRQSREVTRRRLYLETISKVLPQMGKTWFIDSDHKGVLPLLDLGKGGAR